MSDEKSIFCNNQGIGGFETGGYDKFAIQPTDINWTRLSGYDLPNEPKLLCKVTKENSYVGGLGAFTSFAIDSNKNIIVTESNNNSLNHDNGRLIEINQSGETKELFVCDSSLNSPIIGNGGLIYIVTTAETESTGNKLYCLFPDGRVKWEYNIEYNAYYKASLDQIGNVYVFTYGERVGRLLSISKNGSLNWDYEFNSINWYDPIISKNGIIYIGLNVNKTLCAISKNGEKMWEKVIGQGFGTHPMNISEDGTLYVCLLGTLYALYPDGEVKWTYKPEDANVINTPAIDAQGNLYLNITPYYLVSLNNNGDELWRTDIEYFTQMPPILGNNGKIMQIKFMQHYPQYKSWIDIYSTNGDKLWTYELSGSIMSALIADDNLIYAITNIHTYKKKGWQDKMDVKWEMHVIGDNGYNHGIQKRK